MSFLEGFTGSLGSYFSNQAQLDAQAKREMASYEQKLKLAKELEKTTVVKQEVFERDGKTFAAGLNSMGEKVGEERPATDWEIAQYKRTQEAASLDKQSKEANIRANTLQGDKYKQDMGFAPEREKRDAAESAAQIAASGASAANSSANANYQNLITELTKKGVITPGRGGAAQGVRASDLDTLLTSAEFQTLQAEYPEDAEFILNELDEGRLDATSARTRASKLLLIKSSKSQPLNGSLGSNDINSVLLQGRYAPQQ